MRYNMEHKFSPDFSLSNPNASKEAKELIRFLESIQGKRILSGQHSNKASCPDIGYIKRMTGKTPAVLGFDLLSYSNAVETPESTWECIDEVENNKRSVEAALEWAGKGAVITLTWHWFSPTKGRNKSFYAENTDFVLPKVLKEKGMDYEAMLLDLERIAGVLKAFKDEKVPVLWRPLHEADGNWFWWGANPAAFKELYRLMYKLFTEKYRLDNLIWVLNAPGTEYYPGDDVVDINSIDSYADKIKGTALKGDFERLSQASTGKKPNAIGEIGTIPDLDALQEGEIPWLWYMLWNSFPADPQWNTVDGLIRGFNHPFSLNLEDLQEYKK